METRTIRLTRQELDSMDPDALTELLLAAVEVRGTAYVTRADGTIKYDNPALAGTYGEPEQEDEEHGS